MHLLFSTEDVLSYDPNLRLAPPLGNPADQAALVQAVKAGVIDAIAIDHSPYTYEEKTVAFQNAPPGAIGLELAFAVLWQRLVTTGEWTALELLQVISSGPAQCLGLPTQGLQIDCPLQAFLFDPLREWVVDANTLHTPATNTPFCHQTLTGRVLQVWLGF